MTAKAGRADVYRAGKQCPLYFERWEKKNEAGKKAQGTGGEGGEVGRSCL